MVPINKRAVLNGIVLFDLTRNEMCLAGLIPTYLAIFEPAFSEDDYHNIRVQWRNTEDVLII